MGKLAIKYGSYQNYKALASPNADTLYFITDRHLIFKGNILVTGKIGIQLSGSGADELLTITDYDTNTGGTPQTYTVKTSSAITAIINTISGNLDQHRQITSSVNADGKATDSNYGHVELSDTYDGSSPAAAASGGTAATPKAVADALQDAKDYADSLVGGLSGAMVFKGTVGTGGTVTQLPADHAIGDTYRVITAGTYAGQHCEIGDMIICITAGATQSDSDWTVAQNNIDGAVTANDNLEEDGLVLGAGANKTVKKLSAGSTGQWLQQTANGPAWATMRNVSLGIGYGACTTGATSTNARMVSMTGFNLVTGAIVVVYFTNGIGVANATLSVNFSDAKQIYYRGAALDSDTVHAGDVVSMIYNGAYWHILSIEKPIDNALSSTSNNAVRNKVITTALDGKQNKLTPGTGISIETGTTDTISVNFGTVASGNTLPVSGGDVYSAIQDGKLEWEVIPSA